MGLIVGLFLTFIIVSFAIISMSVLIAIGAIVLLFVGLVKVGLLIGLSMAIAVYGSMAILAIIGMTWLASDM